VEKVKRREVKRGEELSSVLLHSIGILNFDINLKIGEILMLTCLTPMLL
jgi:hypothetical protein